MKNPPRDILAHQHGTKRGEEWTWTGQREPGREGNMRTARDSTSVNAKKRGPIDPRMPQMPPA